MDAISRVANNEKQLGGCTGKGFMPGKSGNPSGRPKKLAVSEVFEEILKDPATREQIKQQTIQTLTSRGMAGVLLLREVAERLEGKVTQGIELSGSISTMTDEQVDERLTKLLDLNLEQHEAIDVTPSNEPERNPLTIE